MMDVNIEGLNWEKMDVLLPVIIQDAGTLEVLTLAYIDREALEKAQEGMDAVATQKVVRRIVFGD